MDFGRKTFLFLYNNDRFLGYTETALNIYLINNENMKMFFF